MSGIGFSELLLIAGIIVLFFGSKELPGLMRTVGRFTAQIRRYSDQVRNEINGAMRTIDPPLAASVNPAVQQKKVLRKQYRLARASITVDDQLLRSGQVASHLQNHPAFQSARAVMVYCSIVNEVSTTEIINLILSKGKRLIVPYCREEIRSLGIAAVTDPAIELKVGFKGIDEPMPSIRDNFFKSDLELIVCPGVSFDRMGRRLGQGGGYYDNFLRELKGHVPIWGIGFDCQIHAEQLPFDYHDIVMDQVVTESGLLISR